ncbi:endonuclease/exonuclease/phosphatase family protein [Photobacterium rosenbergii]|uniref:Endonuclease/exonuclease/phosphatase family protein n=1 Tax=Photobacterium rosenbergii TaxID=294936 RepID=A0ABU3ZC28_9GAMM|nr:endonuclease/exonuclease/phosphatase family protein [Photobacterium rosenbergii]MDV5167669.1 endonuclease/exonuclease/phosphatase family protein [Photobacterium rosenbergii]
MPYLTDNAQPDNTIKIATFNLCNYLAPPDAFYDFENIYSQEQWDRKQTWIRTYLEDHQPDVVGFQEVFSSPSLQQLTKESGYAYFTVIDEPNVVDDYIYDSPVVAIASRFPITGFSAVPEDANLNGPLGISDSFSFSRKPLRATIQLPQLGECDFYVVHFKSKRPIVDEGFRQINIDTAFYSEIAADNLRAEILGQWASTQQRSAEAAQLINAIWKRKMKSGLPAILMGDFNDELETSVLHHLLADGGRQKNDAFSNAISQRFRLQQSWSLFQASLCHREFSKLAVSGSVNDIAEQNVPIPSKHPAPYTFYYGAKGMVLDYILLSGEFDASFDESLAEVYDYHLYDKHLINPSYDIDSHSTDHAVVMISLLIRQ